jgi:hypothetical protein
MEAPFKSKVLNMCKLYRRKHGYAVAPVEILAGESFTFNYVIPYPKCKINEIEIVGCKNGDTSDLLVYMGEVKLNQFGFNVALPDGIYRDTSEYDADLVAGLTVRVVIKNNQTTAQKYNINYTLHEMKDTVFEVIPEGAPVIGEQPSHEPPPIYITEEEGIPV